ncbi:hypothetical protein GUJ93_ZPchr0007g4380 [Zizania palustris]|uniref:Uncharacterized protein n=1 Tax=Zizania palustris TaxID=103762 RepID=A0A8J5T3V5_ZIZPA|nr:hypothetical protein GUJ93_ZPchr0007g4380 [Zizania palustris]
MPTRLHLTVHAADHASHPPLVGIYRAGGTVSSKTNFAIYIGATPDSSSPCVVAVRHSSRRLSATAFGVHPPQPLEGGRALRGRSRTP